MVQSKELSSRVGAEMDKGKTHGHSIFISFDAAMLCGNHSSYRKISYQTSGIMHTYSRDMVEAVGKKQRQSETERDRKRI